jgi:hypothetical protein
MAPPLARRPEPRDGSRQAAPAGPVAAEYLVPPTGRGIAAQAAAALGLPTGLWVAISPLFLTPQHGGASAANVSNMIAGLVTADIGAFALASPRGFRGLQLTSLLLGVWVIISSFILDAMFPVAAPMYWSNTWSGATLVVLALAGLASWQRATPYGTERAPVPPDEPDDRSPAVPAVRGGPRHPHADRAGRGRHAERLRPSGRQPARARRRSDDPGDQRLLDLARAHGMHVVCGQDTHRDGDPEWQIWPEHSSGRPADSRGSAPPADHHPPGKLDTGLLSVAPKLGRRFNETREFLHIPLAG